MTVSNEQIQATLNAHENRFVVNEAAIAHHDATFADIRRNLDYASQVLAQVAVGQEEMRQRQEEMRQQQEESRRQQEESRRQQEESRRQQEESRRQIDLLIASDARTQAKMESNQEYIALLAASITELRNTVADMVRSQGGTPSS
jgi:chromosome segregation ATPase